MTDRVQFVATAKLLEKKHDGERVGAWTDGLMVSSEHERGWPCAMRLVVGMRYRVTIELDAPNETR